MTFLSSFFCLQGNTKTEGREKRQKEEEASCFLKKFPGGQSNPRAGRKGDLQGGEECLEGGEDECQDGEKDGQCEEEDKAGIGKGAYLFF